MSNIPLDPGERLVKANGVDICCQTFGRPADPALLLIMGLGAQMIVWDEAFCEALAARGYYVIRFDNRDIGKSSQIGVAADAVASAFGKAMRGESILAPYLLKDMAADSVGVLDALGAAKAHVVGASMGGMIAQEMAMRFPDRVVSLTSIMSTTSEPGLPGPRPEVGAVFVAPPPRNAAEYVESNVRAWDLFRNGGFPEERPRDRARAERAAQRGFFPEGGARQFVAVLASGSRKSGLANVTAPTLVIHGADDPLVPLPAGEATARAIPGARLLVIERMGHALPQAVWPQILDAIVAHAKAATPQDASAPAPAAIEAPATGLGRLAALAMRMLRGHKG